MWTKSFALLAAVLLLASAGCRIRAGGHISVPAPPRVEVRAEVAPPPPPPTATVTLSAGQPELHEGVVVFTPTCTPGAPELLNGIDDNCDGRVDEGFVQSGAVQITLGWATGADIDLYVTDPFGQEVSYRSTTVGSGGTLDRDARGACTDGSTTENVFWPAGAAPRGTYRVDVHYFSDCRAAGVTPITMSIMVGGQALGVYRYNLSQGQRISLASFTIP